VVSAAGRVALEPVASARAAGPVERPAARAAVAWGWESAG
jgi:hypothetical protein